MTFCSRRRRRCLSSLLGNLRTTTKFTTTLSVDWERTGTGTSDSAGERKLQMQSVGSSTTTLNVYIKVKLFIYNFFNGILVHDSKQNTHSPSGFEELIQFHEVFGSIARIEQETCHSSAMTCSLFFLFCFVFVFFHHGNTYFQLSALRKLFSISILFPLY